jgi:hypothetical protein
LLDAGAEGRVARALEMLLQALAVLLAEAGVGEGGKLPAVPRMRQIKTKPVRELDSNKLI